MFCETSSGRPHRVIPGGAAPSAGVPALARNRSRSRSPPSGRATRKRSAARARARARARHTLGGAGVLCARRGPTRAPGCRRGGGARGKRGAGQGGSVRARARRDKGGRAAPGDAPVLARAGAWALGREGEEATGGARKGKWEGARDGVARRRRGGERGPRNQALLPAGSARLRARRAAERESERARARGQAQARAAHLSRSTRATLSP